MAWFWAYERAAEAVPDGGSEEPTPDRSAEFPAQADAETWLGQEFQALLEYGVEAVTLHEDERAVYGPMSLRP